MPGVPLTKHPNTSATGQAREDDTTRSRDVLAAAAAFSIGGSKGRPCMRTSVLVVDDDSDFRRVMRTILEDAGFTVFEASNGTAAMAQLAQLADGAYGMVVLLDLFMPGINGFDVLHALAQDEQLASHHAFLVATAMDTRALPVDVLKLLMDLRAPLLQKPFHIDELLEVIRAAEQRLTPLPRFRASDA